MNRPVCERQLGTGLNLQSIKTTLQDILLQFVLVNNDLNGAREAMDEEVLENLASGYELVNQLITSKVELFALGNSAFLLELNTRVLCGTGNQKRLEYSKHISANNNYFYERTDAGIQDLSEWYAIHRHESVWQRAAGVYIRIVSEPQVFIEGNDRTGTLVMSYILAKEGQPPFVLSPDNAREYFHYSALVKNSPRNSLNRLFRLPRLKAQIAAFLKRQANPGYLL